MFALDGDKPVIGDRFPCQQVLVLVQEEVWGNFTRVMELVLQFVELPLQNIDQMVAQSERSRASRRGRVGGDHLYRAAPEAFRRELDTHFVNDALALSQIFAQCENRPHPLPWRFSGS